MEGRVGRTGSHAFTTLPPYPRGARSYNFMAGGSVAYMANSGYEPYILPSVSVSKSRIQVCLRQDLYAEFRICILLFTHPSTWHVGCTLHSASVSRIRIPYLGLIPHPVSRIPSPYPVFGAHFVPCLMFPVSFILFLGCALHFASCGLGRIPYSVSRIRIPYRGSPRFK